MIALLLRKLVTTGELTVIDATGKAHRFGPGGAPSAVIRFRDRLVPMKLFLNPDVRFGEAYVNGDFVIENGSIRDVLYLCTANLDALEHYCLRQLQLLSRLVSRIFWTANSLRSARHNVARHYDLSHELYRRFLDADMQYSCAYFAREGMTLEEAQAAKKEHIARKLFLKPGMRVLDIGCGWGGMGVYLAKTYGVHVTGITLSAEQLTIARERAREANVDAAFLLQDYREIQGKFDRIVSVGMFEHVGPKNFRTFFQKMRELLTEDGVALLHAIGRMEPPGGTNPWIRKYIFPGGYCPALSEVTRSIENTNLWVTDMEILRLHYARTLECWYQRFEAQREAIRKLYDERFCRIWEFYLAACEMVFLHGRQMVFQIQIAKEKDSVPLTRNYLCA